jgi:hypothetical protein
MRVWQAQIGLSKRVEKEYYGYVEVRDYNPNEFELPNPLLMLFMTQKNNSKSIEFLERMFADVDKTIFSVKSRFDSKNISEELKSLANNSFYATPNLQGQAALQLHSSELTEAFALGVAVGRHDPSRRGENPVVAIGLHKEAINKLQKEYPENDSVGSACAVMLQRGFYVSRAVNF